MATTPTIASIGPILQKIRDMIVAKVREAEKGWPEGAAVGDKIIAIIEQETAALLAANLKDIAAELGKEVLALVQTGKSPVSKSAADIA